MPAKLISIPFVLLLLIVSCTSTPEIVTETVVQVVTVEIEVTRLVVEEVEVTREVYLIDEVAIEVTRLVEIEPAADSTVEATPEPTMTATAAVVTPWRAAMGCRESRSERLRSSCGDWN